MELLNILIPFLGTIAVAFLGYRVNKQLASATVLLNRAQAENEDSASVKTLSESTKIQIETYTDLIVKPLRQRLDEIVQDLTLSKADNKELTERLTKALSDMDNLAKELSLSRAEAKVIKEELFTIKVLFKQAEDSLDYLIGQVKESFPNEVNIAIKIRKGTNI